VSLRKSSTLLLAVVVSAFSLVAGVQSPSARAAPTGTSQIPLLTDVSAQDMGTFDRVTFVFGEGQGLPTILEAAYATGPAVFSPSGIPVDPPVAGSSRIMVTLSGASGIDLTAVPYVVTYTGPKRFAPDLPSVVELVETQDFEATLTWQIGVRGFGTTAQAQVLTSPTRVVVDVPHDTRPVTAQPSFTG
jgi:hypothetical protein